MNKKNIVLFLPDLLRGYQEGAFPALNRILSRASCIKNAPRSLENGVKSFFQGLGIEEIPSGALGALNEGIIDRHNNHVWCQVAPIECTVDHQAAYINGNAQLNLTPAEMQILTQLISPLFEQAGMKLILSSSQTWFCELQSNAQVVMNDLLESLGKNMGFLLPSGPDAMFWHRLMTECQMVLTQSSVNESRQKHHLPLISSLWFWGLGALPSNISTSFSQVITNNATMGGLAKLSGTALTSLPDKFDKSVFSSSSLIFDDKFSILFKHKMQEAYTKQLIYYENHWFAPLLDGLEKGDIRQLSIMSGDGREFRITPWQLKYFWKRIKPMEAFYV